MLRKKLRLKKVIYFIWIYGIFSLLLLLAILAMEVLHLKEDLRSAAFQIESLMPKGYHERFKSPDGVTEVEYMSFLNDVGNYSSIKGIDDLMVLEVTRDGNFISFKLPRAGEEMFHPYATSYGIPFEGGRLDSIIDSLRRKNDPGDHATTLYDFSGEEDITSIVYNRDYYDNPYVIIVGRSLKTFLSSIIRRSFYIVGIVLFLQSICLTVFYSVFSRLRDKELTVQRDDLTGFYTRKFLPEVKRIVSETEEVSWGIIYIDLDRLKSINDSLGHSAGDRYIASFASMMRRSLRNHDYIIRMGGDEFLVVAPIKEAAHLDMMISRLRERSNSELSYSLGWEFIPADPAMRCPFEDTLKKADMNMYEDKKRRKAGR